MRDLQVFILVGTFVCSIGAMAQTTSTATDEDKALVAAVQELRRVDRSRMTQEQMREKATALSRAWATIAKAGPAGMKAVKAELAAIESAKERDDFFRLSTGPLMWECAGLDACDDIAAAWQDVPLATQYNYVFGTAINAARTRDVRALPVLTALLRDRDGEFPVPAHAMVLRWPITTQVVWGIFGPTGLPALVRVLQTSTDSVERASAIILLTSAQHLPSLPLLRKLVESDQVEVAQQAIQAIGHFGHPQDFELLVELAGAQQVPIAFAAAFALVEYEDMRAVPIFCTLLQSPEKDLRQEAIAGLDYLINVQGLEALRAYAAKNPSSEDGKYCGTLVSRIMERLELKEADFDALPRPQKEQRLAQLRTQAEARFQLHPDDRVLGHDQLVEATAQWIKNHRITGGEYAWVEDRHVANAATPADIDLLLQVRGAVLMRVSDECFMEVGILEALIRRIGRSRYRAQVGVTEKVASPTAATSPAGQGNG